MSTIVAAFTVGISGVSAQTPPDDDLPPLPPLPKAAEKATFDLIVEGTGFAHKQVGGSGSNGACSIVSNTNSVQQFTYGRGKDLRVVFSKYKFPGGSLVLLKREGQKRSGALFTVKGSYVASAEGSATRTGDPAVCVPASETVGDEAQCGPSGNRRTNLLLSYIDDALTLDVSARTTVVPTGTGCGSNGVETASGEPFYGWGNFLPLKPENLSPGLIFGGKKKFKVPLKAAPKQTETDQVFGGFTLRSSDVGEHEAVARFIRDRG